MAPIAIAVTVPPGAESLLGEEAAKSIFYPQMPHQGDARLVSAEALANTS